MQLEYFQLVDRIIALDIVGQTIAAEATLPFASTIFEGHFPGYPVMPGVLLIEAMAQTSGWLLIASTNFEQMSFLAAVKQAKMRAFVSPGAKLEISARIAHQGSGFAMINAEITVAGKKVCDASLTLSQQSFPSEDLRKHMVIVAERVGLPRPS